MDSLCNQFCQPLLERYTRSEASALWRLFVSEVCHWPESRTYFCKDSDFTDTERTRLLTIANQLAQGIPYQHLTGYQELRGLRWKVSPDVLIPRPETAELVDWIVDDCHDHTPHTVLDLGTGSGFLAVSLALAFESATVIGLDISTAALRIANDNALQHQAKVTFVEGNMCATTLPIQAPLDLIVSNPPYICPSEASAMNDTVLDHEPHLALFAPEHDPLLFYRAIAHHAQTLLAPHGILYLEINQRYGTDTCTLLQTHGFQTELRRDTFGNDRMIKAQKG